jgi:hypothetical protein
MGHTRHLSRREILNAIPVLGAGSLLLPLRAQRPDTRAPAIIKGALLDGATGRPMAAKLRVVETGTGDAYFPAGAIRTRPQRNHYFYASGAYEVAVPVRDHACTRHSHPRAARFAPGRVVFGQYPYTLSLGY